MVELLSVPLEEAKKALIKTIEDVDKDDILKYTTTWTKNKNSEKLFRSLIIEIDKNGKKEE